MAINKRKVLEAARKYAQKGAKEKALKEYNRLIQSDPRDAKLLLEVGDAYRRWGQVEEAIAQYNKVANQYKQDGFDARAVAVLKQILNLDPKCHTAQITLAELYQRMGLDSEAVSALQTAADGYYREGRRREALELLRKMAALDPTNTTSRLKVAELLKQENMEEDAVAEYSEVVSELARQGAVEQVVVVQERILEIKPERVDVLLALTQNLCDLGEPQRAEVFAVQAVELVPEPDNYELLCGIYKSLGNEAELAAVTRRLAGLYRDRGDEEHAREVLQRLPAECAPSLSGIGGDESEADEDALLGDDELLNDEDFLVTDDGLDAGDDQKFLDLAGDASASEQADVEVLPEGDPDQLFAEASVYLRYGKRDQAIASLKAILIQDPSSRSALEKLGEAYAEGGHNDEAVGCWLQAADRASADGDQAGCDILRDRIAALDPTAVADLDSSPSEEPQQVAQDAAAESSLEQGDFAAAPSSDDSPELGIDFDMEIDLGGDESAAEVSEAPDEEAASEAQTAPGADLDLEIDLGGDESAAEVSEPPDEEAASEAQTAPGADLDLEIDLGGDESAAEVSEAPDEEVASEAQTAPGADLDSQIELGGDEPVAEASAAPDERVASEAPTEPGVDLDPQIEVDVAADDEMDVEISIDGPGVTGVVTEPEDEAEQQPDVVGDEIEIELDSAGADAVAGTEDAEQQSDVLDQSEVTEPASSPSSDAEQSTTTAAQISEDLEEAEFYLQQGLADEAEAIYKRILAIAPNHPSALLKLGELAAARGEDPSEVTERVTPEQFETRDGVEPVEDAQTTGSPADSAEFEQGLEAELTQPDADLTAGIDDVEVNADADTAADTDSDVDADSDAEPTELESGVGVQGADETTPHVGDDSTEVERLASPVDPPTAFESEPLVAEPPRPTAQEASIDDTAPVAAAADDAGFDLAEALADVLEQSDESTAEGDDQTSEVLSSVDDGFESIFADFKRGVSATLEEGDFDTRYDLGIAYREMGLFDDALAEFRVCLNCPTRRFDSLCLMGLCALEVGRCADAVSHLEQALATPDLPTERQAGVYFDLSRAYEANGDRPRAKSALENVQQLDASFPGVAERLAELEEAGDDEVPLELQSEDEEYESFDDLIAEQDDDAEEPSEPEVFESFDDVLAEAEAVVESAERAGEASASAAPELDSRSGKRPGRKKKISFV